VSSGEFEYDCIVITSYLKREQIYNKLLDVNTPEKDIKVIFAVAR
jgi:hypothetical protein